MTGDGTTQPKPDTGRAGIILAGGRSARFPTVDKALAPLGGTPLLCHAVGAVDPTVDELIVNCREEQQASFAAALSEFDVQFALDPVADRGPLVGLRTALETASATYAGILPCDMPLVPAAFIDVLFSRARNRTGAVPTIDNRVQPFPSVVHVRAATAACHEAARRGTNRLESFVSILDPRVISERAVCAHVDPRAFTNINTHEDLAAARAQIPKTEP